MDLFGKKFGTVIEYLATSLHMPTCFTERGTRKQNDILIQ